MRDITLIPLHTLHPAQHWRLYYYMGNFFYPIIPNNFYIPAINRAKISFIKQNRTMIAFDRAKPEYRTKLQLMDAQWRAQA